MRQPGLLITGQLRHEVRGEALDITPDLFVETFGCSCLISTIEMKVKGQGSSAIIQGRQRGELQYFGLFAADFS